MFLFCFVFRGIPNTAQETLNITQIEQIGLDDSMPGDVKLGVKFGALCLLGLHPWSLSYLFPSFVMLDSENQNKFSYRFFLLFFLLSNLYFDNLYAETYNNLG